jgi:hypothetical protein
MNRLRGIPSSIPSGEPVVAGHHPWDCSRASSGLRPKSGAWGHLRPGGDAGGRHSWAFLGQVAANSLSLAAISHPSVNGPIARCRQVVCRGLLVPLPGDAFGVRPLRVAAQAARGALRGSCCCARRSAWWSLPVVWLCSCRHPGSVWSGALARPPHAPTDSTTDDQPTPARDRHHRKRYRPTVHWAAVARVSRLRCRGLRLRHDGFAHRGSPTDSSRAGVSLPSHGVMICETSSHGPPHVSHEWFGSGRV